MGLSWQQGPLSTGAIGRFLIPEPLPKRLLYAEALRRPMRVRFVGKWITDLGTTSWFAVCAGDRNARRGAWQHTGLLER